MISKSLFPACASFGPVFLAFGSLFPNRGGWPIGGIVALVGAFMTSAAMMILFRLLVARDENAAER